MRNPGIQVISRASAILRLCSAATDGLSLGNIATAIGLPRSTVQRIVNALVTEGLLYNDGTRRSIRTGRGLHALLPTPRADVIEIAHPFLKALSQTTGETVDLALLRGDHLVFVDQVAGSQRLRTVSSVGEIFPLHNTANGKAALSLLSEADVRNALLLSGRAQGAKLARLVSEIERARRTGIAEDNDEHMEGISAIGTAFSPVGGNIYAISIPLPSVRFKSRKKELAVLLLAFRSQIDEALKS
jgi:DNA-binding IclR family transcriptional regulator